MLRVRQPLLAVVGAGPSTATATGSSTVDAAFSALATFTAAATGSSTVAASFSGSVTSTASAAGSSTVAAILSALATFDASATGSSTVTAVGSSSVVAKPIQGLTFLFGALYDAGGGGAADASATGVSVVSAGFSALATFDAAAVGSSTVSAVGSTAGSAVTADASATGSSTVDAAFSALATFTASATGSSTVNATTGGRANAPSVEQKFARWASYRRVGSNYIRQVSPGVYLRVRPEERVPQVVVQESDVGRLDEVPLRGQAIALGLTKTDQRKLRKELRRIEVEERRVTRICGTVASCSGSSKVGARGAKSYSAKASGKSSAGARMSARATANAEATNGGIEHALTIRYHGITKQELVDILEQLEII